MCVNRAHTDLWVCGGQEQVTAIGYPHLRCAETAHNGEIEHAVCSKMVVELCAMKNITVSVDDPDSQAGTHPGSRVGHIGVGVGAGVPAESHPGIR